MRNQITKILIVLFLTSSQVINAQINCNYTQADIYCLDYVQDFFDGAVAYTFSSTDYQDLRIHNATNDNGEEFIYLMIFTQTNQFSFGELWEVYDCNGNLVERCESVGLAITCEIGDPETPRDEIIYSANTNGDLSFPSCSSCTDGMQNGDEVGVDCGGPDCPPCETGCTDPESNNYNPNASEDDGSCAYCCDGEQNGSETGVDCGGPICLPCNYTLDCDATVNSFTVTSIPFMITIDELLGVEGACNISFDSETSSQSYQIDCSDFGTQSSKLDSLLLYDTVTEDSCFVKYNISKASNLCTCGQDDYPALMDLYHATNGDNWRFNSGWSSGALGSSCIPCDWYGIVCNDDNRVIAINLDTNFMEGIIPSTISEINDLVLLDLNGNELKGIIPEEIGQLNELEFLTLNNNQIEGIIPQVLGSLTKLKRIVLFDNQIEGEIPNNFTNLDDLEWLMLSNNKLTGAIPSNLNQLDNLIVLWLSGNELSGSIPSEITGMSSLINLFLQENNLTGEIPINIGFLNNIDKLLLNDNNLEGCFPASLDNLCGIGESNSVQESGYNFSGNNLLPFGGDYERICNGEDQTDAFCGSLQDSLIDVNCMCVASPPSITCSMDTEEILCYDWLNSILTNTGGCIDPGSSAFVLRVYTTSHDGNPAILVDNNFNCINPSIFGAGYTLYTCEGDQIASCTYAGFNDCDNPPNDHPILGPAFDNGILIYNSEVDVLPDCTAQRPFITTWKTDNPGTSCSTCITIPTTGVGYNYDVDWENDGVYDDFDVTGNIEHDYGSAGTYTVAIRGDFPRIYFNNEGDKDKIMNIDQWGEIEWSSMESAFWGCENLNSTAIDAPDLSNVTSLKGMFVGAKAFNGNIDNWDVSNITNISSMFWGAESFNQSLNSWDVSQVQDMSSLFSGALSFNGSIGDWEVGNVSNMFEIFRGAILFNQPIGNWNVENVTTLRTAFFGAESFNQDIGSWDVSKVTSMNSLFRDAVSFNKDISDWKVSTVNNMGFMFSGAESFNQPIGNWDVSALTIMISMFRNALSFNQPINEWDVSSINNSFGMETVFLNASSFNQPLQDWDVSNATGLAFMFKGATSFNQSLGSWDLQSASNIEEMLNNSGLDCENYSTTLMGWADNPNTPNNLTLGAEGMEYSSDVISSRDALLAKGWTIDGDAQGSCSTAQRPFITTWKTDNPGTSCSSCITIPTEGGGYNYDVDWDNDGVYDEIGVSGNVTHDYGSAGTYTVAIRGDFPRIHFDNVGDKSKLLEVNQWGDIAWSTMERSFYGCDNFTLNALDTPDLTLVTNMNLIFGRASILNQDISNWDVSNVTDMSSAFILTPLFNQDLSSWDVSNVINMGDMFAGATNFNQDLSSWDVSNVTNMNLMFWEALNFNQDISSWDVSSVTSMNGMFAEASNFDQDLSSWIVDNVIDMGAMFRLASNFNGDISGWNTNQVEVFSNMFNEATSFNQSLASWDLSSAINMENMFNDSMMECDNYSSTLVGWADNSNTPSNLTLGAENIEFGQDAIPARDLLIAKGWTFIGDIQGSCGIPCPDDEVFVPITLCPDSLSTITLADFANQNPNGDDVSGWLGSTNLVFGDNTFVIDISENCSYTQTVTVIEDTEANCDFSCPDIAWVNPPSDVTIDYNQLSSIDYDLSYANGGADECDFSGIVQADTTVVNDGCDKILRLEWSVTDNAMTIDTQQVVRITNVPVPIWLDPIDNVEISCDDIPAIEDRLEYSNGTGDFCDISGFVQAIITVDTAICSEDRLLDWNWDGAGCFDDLSHTQTISVLGCNDFTLNDDFLSATTKENLEFNLLDNDISLIPNVDYSIEITEIGDDLVQDTMLSSDGLFSFRLADSFFDTIKVSYKVCDIECNICEEAIFFITDEILEDIVPTNYLSPNGDGQNDQLRFTREDVMDDAELWIYNRWGDQLYHKENYTNDWDAQGIPSGVYYYVLQVRGVTLKRTLTILK